METQETSRYHNPVEYLKVFFRRKWLFFFPAFIGLVLGIVACFILPPTYESYSVILVQEEKTINPLMQGLAISADITQRMETIKEQLLGWNSLIVLTKKLDLAKNINNQIAFEKMVLELRKNIYVKLYGPMLVKISYYGKEPKTTQLVAQTLSDILVEENMRAQTKEADVAINFIKEQLDVYKRKIKETEVANLEEQLRTLLVDSTEMHPMVKELRQKIANAKKELESGEYKVPNAGRVSLTPTYEALKQELDKMINKEAPLDNSGSLAYAAGAGDATDPNSTIYKLMLMDKLDTVHARDMSVNENIYNMLLQKFETAKITQRLEASKEGTRYSVLDPARMPLRPVKPNKIAVTLIGLFLGSVAGTGFVFGREFMDHSILDIEDAKQSLELPVLGAISRLITQEEIDKEKNKKKTFIITASVSSAVLIVIAMLVYLLRK